MVIEQGTGEIDVDGKITKVGPGSVMYTAPNVSHGIVNTGDTPIVFYFIKWAGKDASDDRRSIRAGTSPFAVIRGSGPSA